MQRHRVEKPCSAFNGWGAYLTGAGLLLPRPPFPVYSSHVGSQPAQLPFTSWLFHLPSLLMAQLSHIHLDFPDVPASGYALPYTYNKLPPPPPRTAMSFPFTSFFIKQTQWEWTVKGMEQKHIKKTLAMRQVCSAPPAPQLSGWLWGHGVHRGRTSYHKERSQNSLEYKLSKKMFPNLHTAVLGHRNLQNNKWTNKASSQAKNKKEQTKPKTEKNMNRESRSHTLRMI